MRAWIVPFVALLLSSVVAFGEAQSPCEDSVRTLKILAEQYAASRQRTEIEAAQTISGLMKQIESLRAELEAAKKASAK